MVIVPHVIPISIDQDALHSEIRHVEHIQRVGQFLSELALEMEKKNYKFRHPGKFIPAFQVNSVGK